MEVEQVLHMNGGEGKTSYAKNSLIQKQGMCWAKPILEETIRKLSCSNFPKGLKIADLGCSSGPNTLLLVREIIDIVDDTCQRLNQEALMFQVFLNDLPGNDFNAIFRSLPSFSERLMKEKGSNFGPCFIAGMPGTFYGRLFPNNFLHFVHSSYSLHWRSQVPESLTSTSGILLNKGNICMAKTSPHSVHKAYFDLFERDFRLFLKSRFEEIIPGGHMVLAILGTDRKTNSSNNKTCTVWELLGMALHDMVQESLLPFLMLIQGLIEEAKLDQFNLPYYAPTPEEVRHVIQTEGSFNIQRFKTYKIDWDANIKNGMKGKNVARNIRAVAESLLENHFTNLNMDDLFERFAKKIAEYLEEEKGQCTTIAISMTKA